MSYEVITLVFAAAIAGCYLAAVSKLLRVDQQPARRRGLLINDTPSAGAQIVEVSSWLNTRIGLLNHPGLAEGAGLLLRGVKSVHTQGMLFPIDVVFLDKELNVLAVEPDVEPGQKRLKGPKGTAAVLEVNAGHAARALPLKAGDTLKLA